MSIANHEDFRPKMSVFHLVAKNGLTEKMDFAEACIKTLHRLVLTRAIVSSEIILYDSFKYNCRKTKS